MVNGTEEDKALELLFGAARRKAESPSPDFMARLNADVENLVVEPEIGTHTKAQPAESVWSRFVSVWIPASGLTAATAIGILIGVTVPSAEFASGILTAADYEIDTFLPGAGFSSVSSLETDG